MDDVRLMRLGMIGLGQMGLGMAVNLVKEGFGVKGFDLRAEACGAFEKEGGEVARSGEELVETCDVVMTSLVAPVYLRMAEELFLPRARAGQIFIDTSTVPAPRARELAKRFAEKGAVGLDAPVTGGGGASMRGELRMFVGGDAPTYERCLPLFEAVCKEDGVTYGGEAGHGQVLKIVQQLKNRITDAVRLEVIAFGSRAGLTLEQVRRALDVSKEGNDPYGVLIEKIEKGEGDSCDVVFAEWGYYLEEARARGIAMPALEGMYRFAKDGEAVCRDGVGRMAPSIWRELMRKG